MQSTIRSISSKQPQTSEFFGRMWETSKFLTAASLIHFFLIGVTLVGLLVDPQTVLNEPAWIKPLKFSMSIAVYCATIAWMLSYIEKPRWLIKTIAVGTGIFLTGESALIILQAARGVRSHFNFSTEFDSIVFGLMGTFIMLLWVLNLVLVILLLLQRFERPLFKWSLMWGLVIAMVGGFMAYDMTEQLTPDQQEIIDSGETSAFQGGHTVGAEDGGPGLPLLGWSTTHGDLRVAHFIGLHALQIIPLIGLAIENVYRRRLAENQRLILLFLAGAGYLGLVTTTYQQAIRGYSIVSFDDLTVVLSAILLIVVVGGWMAVLRFGQSYRAEWA
ncbi:MAG: hypothetical protein QNJ45_02220 [Ardenticatenaceae bacterium]|nr:hypothetical protein [Ardenticatenaceae bacterium]